MTENKLFQVEPLTTNVLANLTVEELQQRLEMQMIQLTPGGLCFIDYSGDVCTNNTCGADCSANTGGGS